MPRGVTRSPARRLAEKFKTTRRISELAMDAAEEEADDLVDERLTPLHEEIAALRSELALMKSAIEMNGMTIERIVKNQADADLATERRIERITRAQLASFVSSKD